MNKHEEMQKYFAAIIKIAESNEQEKEEVANEQTTVQKTC